MYAYRVCTRIAYVRVRKQRYAAMVDPSNEKKKGERGRKRKIKREREKGREEVGKKKDFSALQPDIKGRF